MLITDIYLVPMRFVSGPIEAIESAKAEWREDQPDYWGHAQSRIHDTRVIDWEADDYAGAAIRHNQSLSGRYWLVTIESWSLVDNWREVMTARLDEEARS